MRPFFSRFFDLSCLLVYFRFFAFLVVGGINSRFFDLN